MNTAEKRIKYCCTVPLCGKIHITSLFTLVNKKEGKHSHPYKKKLG